MPKQTKQEENTAQNATPAKVQQLAPETTTPTEPAKVQAEEEMVHLIVFKLGSEEYGIKIEQVKEVTVTPVVTRMPRTPAFIKGVANIRGDIIAIMDMEERFEIAPSPATTEVASAGMTYTLVIEAKDYKIGVVVKEVPQSLNMAMSKIDKTPAFLQDSNIKESYIDGIAKTGKRLIVVLDMLKILSQEEVQQLLA